MYFCCLVKSNDLSNHSSGCCFCVDYWIYDCQPSEVWTLDRATVDIKFTLLSLRNRIRNPDFFYKIAQSLTMSSLAYLWVWSPLLHTGVAEWVPDSVAPYQSVSQFLYVVIDFLLDHPLVGYLAMTNNHDIQQICISNSDSVISHDVQLTSRIS